MYQLLQLSPQTLKEKMRTTSVRAEKNQLILAMVLRSILLIAFAIVYITLFTKLFGAANSSVAVSSFCILLGVRFVSYGVNVIESLGVLALYLVMTFVGGLVTASGNLFLALIVHFIFLLVTLITVANEPILGNGGIYVFGYLFMVENPVKSSALSMRAGALALAFVLCGLILVQKHRKADKNKHIISNFKNFSLKNATSLWQLRLALGVSVVLFFAHAVDLPRAVWCGYACMSVLLPYSNDFPRRAFQRVAGVVLGSLAFGFFYLVMPTSAHALMGPLAGLCIGFSGTYLWNNILNCFGALLLASTLYGLDASIIFRVENNIIGAVLALLLLWLGKRLYNRATFQKLID